ncbi:MerR family transcriptional regulator [Tissierella carlieri]|uniref:MerR family transcriptional regulator n=1 Tax=Tissierella carlieri TaxID=689904 RepID=UPI001C103703|nr:MerR family transcriptional regulator [Tissierella carlieri]
MTSRTLRYWEQKGLFSSSRDMQSNWRVYDKVQSMAGQQVLRFRYLSTLKKSGFLEAYMHLLIVQMRYMIDGKYK